MHNLASAHSNRGDRKAAEELLRSCLAGRLRTLGESHPATLYTTNDLVFNLRAQGQTGVQGGFEDHDNFGFALVVINTGLFRGGFESGDVSVWSVVVP